MKTNQAEYKLGMKTASHLNNNLAIGEQIMINKCIFNVETKAFGIFVTDLYCGLHNREMSEILISKV